MIGVTRLAEVYNDFMAKFEQKGSEPGCFIGLDNGYFCTVSGTGDMYDEFVRTRQLGLFNGRNSPITGPKDPNYPKAKLRFLPFDHAFNFTDKDVDKRKYSICCDGSISRN